MNRVIGITYLPDDLSHALGVRRLVQLKESAVKHVQLERNRDLSIIDLFLLFEKSNILYAGVHPDGSLRIVGKLPSTTFDGRVREHEVAEVVIRDTNIVTAYYVTMGKVRREYELANLCSVEELIG